MNNHSDNGITGTLPKFTASRTEFDLITKIVERFEKITNRDGSSPLSLRQRGDRMSRLMDIEACHCNGNPLDLVALHEAARDSDLVHDVAGIGRHIDRETGKLGDSFSPRYSARVPT